MAGSCEEDPGLQSLLVTVLIPHNPQPEKASPWQWRVRVRGKYYWAEQTIININISQQYCSHQPSHPGLTTQLSVYPRPKPVLVDIFQSPPGKFPPPQLLSSSTLTCTSSLNVELSARPQRPEQWTLCQSRVRRWRTSGPA